MCSVVLKGGKQLVGKEGPGFFCVTQQWPQSIQSLQSPMMPFVSIHSKDVEVVLCVFGQSPFAEITKVQQAIAKSTKQAPSLQ